MLNMIMSTDYKIDGKAVTYEVYEKGYRIFLDGQKWIYCPNVGVDVEVKCLAHIKEIVESFMKPSEDEMKEQQMKELQEQVDDLQAMVLDLTNIVMMGVEM